MGRGGDVSAFNAAIKLEESASGKDVPSKRRFDLMVQYGLMTKEDAEIYTNPPEERRGITTGRVEKQ